MTCLWVRLPPALLLANTKQPSGGTGRHAILRRSCPQRRASSTLALATFQEQHCRCDRCPTDRHKVGVLGSIPRPATSVQTTLRMGQCSARPHKPGPPGATPGSATSMVEYANRKSDLVESQVILQVRLLSRLLVTNDRVVQRRRRLRDMQKIDGSIPSAITE